jgi:hypothetical protein
MYINLRDDLLLLHCDIIWDEITLMDSSQYRLHTNVKDLYLTFYEDPCYPLRGWMSEHLCV